jgi:biopolymer transport protein TolR
MFQARETQRLLAEINVTPLVDVMMVLLIIVFVTAPLMVEGMDVELPETRTVSELPSDQDHLMLSIGPQGKIKIDKYEVALADLQEHVKRLAADQNKALFLRADAQVPYGVVVEVMGEVKAAGVHRLGVIAQEKDDEPAR